MSSSSPSIVSFLSSQGVQASSGAAAGLFRPEVTLPLGINVPVIAWGLGLDRMAMMALDIQDIRDLFSTDLDLIRSKKGAG